jgi:hypothetical protein
MEWPTLRGRGGSPFIGVVQKLAIGVDVTGHVRPKAGKLQISTVTRLVGHVWLEARTCSEKLTRV